MKPGAYKLILLLIATLLLLSGCAPKQVFTFPAIMQYTMEVTLDSVYRNLPNNLDFGKTRECRQYELPELPPATADVKAFYQAELAKQGWEGDPTEVTETGNRLILQWVHEKQDAGVMVIYDPGMWVTLVCVGNP